MRRQVCEALGSAEMKMNKWGVGNRQGSPAGSAFMQVYAALSDTALCVLPWRL